MRRKDPGIDFNGRLGLCDQFIAGGISGKDGTLSTGQSDRAGLRVACEEVIR